MEITVFCNGDSSNPNTWSNIPYYLTKGIIDNGYTLNRVDLSIKTRLEKIIQRIYDGFFVRHIIKKFYPDTSYSYIRSSLFHWITGKRIKSAVNKFSDTDVFISLSFSYDIRKYTNKKIINWCDWTYEFDILYDQRRNPDILEKYSIQIENNSIKNATTNKVMRIECKDMLKERYSNISDVRGSPVNTDIEIDDVDTYINNKFSSNLILFIGAIRYVDGARELFQSANKMIANGVNIQVHYIGITQDDLGFEKSTQQKCWGYLRKSVPGEQKVYNELIQNAKIVINTNPNFVSAAGINEASYLYTPAIVSMHYQTLKMFGKPPCGGVYCNNHEDDIIHTIQDILSLNYSDYVHFCMESHNRFSSPSWSNYIKLVLNSIGEDNE